jgi:hypothetical protein
VLRHVRSATILLPYRSVRRRIGLHLAKAMLENEQPIETYWYEIVREVIAVADFESGVFSAVEIACKGDDPFRTSEWIGLWTAGWPVSYRSESLPSF